MNNRSEKFWSFLFQSNWLKTSRNERKLMVKQFSAEEVIFLCQYLPNNKSITIMIHHCNFFINKYGRLKGAMKPRDALLLVAVAASDWPPAGGWRQWDPPALVPAQVWREESWDSWRVAGGATPDMMRSVSCNYIIINITNTGETINHWRGDTSSDLD